MFGVSPNELPEPFLSYLGRMDATYREADSEELKEYFLQVLKRINAQDIRRTAEENLAAFEKGWRENLDALLSQGTSAENLKPRYFRPGKFLRYDRKLIVSRNPNLEYDLFTLARYLLFSGYLSSFESIYEIGCGSCQNLFMLSELFPSKRMIGLDWAPASTEIAKVLADSLKRPIEATLFDMMSVSPAVEIEPGSAIMTIHALEQIGEGHEKLLSFLLNARPGIVLHYEPILEFYDEGDALDYLAFMYCRKRNYLSGFYTALLDRQKRGEIQIVEARRPFLGGGIHEASLIIWKPRF